MLGKEAQASFQLRSQDCGPDIPVLVRVPYLAVHFTDGHTESVWGCNGTTRKSRAQQSFLQPSLLSGLQQEASLGPSTQKWP